MTYKRNTKQMNETDRQPSVLDPKELSLRDELLRIFDTAYSKERLREMSEKQMHFLHTSINFVGQNDSTLADNAIRKAYLNLVYDLAGEVDVSGDDNIKQLPSSGFVVVSNHLAIPKATRISVLEIATHLESGDDKSAAAALAKKVPEFEPWPSRIAGSAGAIGKGFSPHEIGVFLPEPFGKIQQRSGVIAIPSSGSNRFGGMVNAVSGIFNGEENSYVIIYPEGGSTGKRGGGGLYGVARENFSSGYLFLAQQLQVPVVFVAQVFDKNYGYKVNVSAPVMIDSDLQPDQVKAKAAQGQQELQESLDKLTS